MKMRMKLGFYLLYALVNVGIFALGFYNIKNIVKIYNYTESVNLLILHTANLNNSIQEHYTTDLTDTNYFKTGISKSIDDYNKYLALTKEEANKILHSDMAADFGYNFKINTLMQNYIDYDFNFNKLLKLYKYKGFIDYGKEGEMRQNAHFLERQKDLSIEHILKLRRYEKDYLLRKSENYIQKHRLEVQELEKEINKSNSPNAKEKLMALKNYESSFANIVNANNQINEIQKENINLLKQNISPILTNIISSIKLKKEVLVNNCIRDFSILSLFFLLSIIILGFKISQFYNQSTETINLYIRNILRRNYNNNSLNSELITEYNLTKTAMYIEKLETILKTVRPTPENFKEDTSIQVGNNKSNVKVANSVSKNFTKLV